MPSSVTLRLGTRASPLARWQANWIAAQLQNAGIGVELIPITTAGDREQIVSLGALGGAGAFTKEIQQALLDDRIDVAVHSLKDLPTETPPGLMLAAVPPRGPIGDVLITAPAARDEVQPDGAIGLDGLPPAAVVGTGSLRRRAQLWHVRPDLVMLDIRGNVDTRLRKLRDGAYDALVLAEAGLHRLGFDRLAANVLPTSVMLPAVGQGALGVEIRADDAQARDAVLSLDCPTTHASVRAERALLAALRGGCLAPVAAWGHVEPDSMLHLTAAVLSADGKTRIAATAVGDPRDAIAVGEFVAEQLIAQGATELIVAARGHAGR